MPILTSRRPPERRALAVPELLAHLDVEGPQGLDAVVVGGGCAGLALATAVTERGGAVAVVDARPGGEDGRTWCYWDTGDALLPEAVSASWDRWEIRTPIGVAVASDVDHPYRMVRAADYRRIARRRIASIGRGEVLDGLRVIAAGPGCPDGLGGVQLFDARGPGATGPLEAGRTRLFQRFVGLWIRTARPVFDTSTVTLMDFARRGTADDVQFFYVLPVAPDLALVECTVFARSRTGGPPFREAVAGYLGQRWGLHQGEWTVDGEEAGCIPMTDQPSPGASGEAVPFGMRAGIARPSTGYAFTRIQIAARSAASALAGGTPLRPVRDPWRTRALDAIFLRFLRDQPGAAPGVFLRMFDRLPGPLTVRFLTERSTLVDDLRMILALPKLPFLRAAATTVAERLRGLAA